MPKRLFVFFILMIFLLAACTGAEQISPTEAPAAEQETAPVETAPTEEPEAPAPAEDAAAGTGASIPAVGAQMECTLVSDQPDVPAGAA